MKRCARARTSRLYPLARRQLHPHAINTRTIRSLISVPGSSVPRQRKMILKITEPLGGKLHFQGLDGRNDLCFTHPQALPKQKLLIITGSNHPVSLRGTLMKPISGDQNSSPKPQRRRPINFRLLRWHQ